jgi:pre-60S factor REI1
LLAFKIDKGHCKIAYESDEDAMEVVDFYDFSSSYPQGYDQENPDADAELADLTNDIQLGDDEMELILPSGIRIGHRSMQRYYKQSFKPDDVSSMIEHQHPRVEYLLIHTAFPYSLETLS